MVFLIIPQFINRLQKMKLFITTILLTICLGVFGQSKDVAQEEIVKIISIEQVAELKERHSNWNIELLKVDITDRSWHFYDMINTLKQGDIKTIVDDTVTFLIKLLEIDTVSEFRASYIYFNGDILSMDKIDSLRTLIIERYGEGVPFHQLARWYTMDGNSDGDLGWFPNGMMVSKFQKSVKEHKKGEIFTVDISARDWYHVVLKTHDNRIGSKLKLIKIELDESQE